MYIPIASRIRLFGIFLLLVCISHTGLGQVVPADSSRISYEEEERDRSDFTLKERYNYLIRSKMEETQIWKLGLNNLGFSAYDYHYGLHLIYERKIHTSFSILGEVSPTVKGYRHTYSNSDNRRLAWEAEVAGKYYYNMKRRMRLGKSGNNFSANYLSAHIRSRIMYQARNDGRKVLEPAILSVRYGLQRRLGRYGFIDANYGIEVLPIVFSRNSSLRYFDGHAAGELRIGLAIGK
jgi:hypothetical protein